MATTFEQPTSTQTSLAAGPRSLPFIGNVLEFRRDQPGYLQQLEREYANIERKGCLGALLSLFL